MSTGRKDPHPPASRSGVPAAPADLSTPSGGRSASERTTKVGYNLLAWSPGLSEALLPALDRLQEIGYDGVECPLGTRDRAIYAPFEQRLKDLGLEATCSMSLGPEENPISESAAVRQKAVDRLKWAVDRAEELTAGLICGPIHSAAGTFSGHPPQDQEVAWSADVLREAGEYAAQADVTLALEALNRFECYLCNTMEQTGRLVEQIDHPNVTVHFDTHHANIEEKDVAEAIGRVAPLLGHVHLSENDRGTPGSGLVPWDEAFAALAHHEYQGWLTLEAFTRSDPAFASDLHVWRAYDEPWQMAEQGYAFVQSMREKHGL